MQTYDVIPRASFTSMCRPSSVVTSVTPTVRPRTIRPSLARRIGAALHAVAEGQLLQVEGMADRFARYQVAFSRYSMSSGRRNRPLITRTTTAGSSKLKKRHEPARGGRVGPGKPLARATCDAYW